MGVSLPGRETGRVLDRSGSVVLLLSDRILGCKRYHHEFVETTWRQCDPRAWLNYESAPFRGIRSCRTPGGVGPLSREVAARPG